MGMADAQKKAVDFNRVGAKFSHVKGRAFRKGLGAFICNDKK